MPNLLNPDDAVHGILVVNVTFQSPLVGLHIPLRMISLSFAI